MTPEGNREKEVKELLDFVRRPGVTRDQVMEYLLRTAPTRKQRIAAVLKWAGFWIGMVVLVWGVIVTGGLYTLVWAMKTWPRFESLVVHALALFMFFAFAFMAELALVSLLLWRKVKPTIAMYIVAVLAAASLVYWYWPEIR